MLCNFFINFYVRKIYFQPTSRKAFKRLAKLKRVSRGARPARGVVVWNGTIPLRKGLGSGNLASGFGN